MYISNTELRVRYAETDKMGVVYHSNYFVWFETGRTEYLRVLGYPYSRLEKEGIMLPVVECNAKYKKGAQYDDEIIVQTSVSELKGASVTMYYEVIRKETEELLTTGYTKHAITDKNLKPLKLKVNNPKLWDALQSRI